MLKPIKPIQLCIHSIIALSIVSPLTLLKPKSAQAIGFAATCKYPYITYGTTRWRENGRLEKIVTLHAWCKQAGNNNNYRWANIELQRMMANARSVLVWRFEGGFSGTCFDPYISYHSQLEDRALLTATCPDGNGTAWYSIINLTEHINNINGWLVPHSLPR